MILLITRWTLAWSGQHAMEYTGGWPVRFKFVRRECAAVNCIARTMSLDNSNGTPTHADPVLNTEVPTEQVPGTQAGVETVARDRFKAESPKIPGVGELQRKPSGISPKHLAGIVAAALLLVGLLTYWAASRNRHVNRTAAIPGELQIAAETPSPAAAPPAATNAEQVVATVAEMGKAWSSKEFVYHDAFSVLTREAILVRLPKGSATQSSGYWAFAMNAAYGNCRLEYITDMSRLREEYGYRQGTHPMVGDPCSRSVIDPLKLSVMPGNVWVHGGIVQGVDVRPPLEIEIIIKGQKIIANRME